VFSGIVKIKGRVLALAEQKGDRQIVIGAEPALLEHLEIGASVAVNGVCLTAVARTAQSFTADVSRATLDVTTLGLLRIDDDVNLEPALKLGDPLDGHLVTGHVDGIGHVLSLAPEARSLRVVIELPKDLARFVANKGAIAVDGVSLTVNGIDAERFEVNVIPHTQATTVISEYVRGTPVNIEVDLIARYLERLAQPIKSSVTYEKLKRHGYVGNE
jgi:riboflavin synthase